MLRILWFCLFVVVAVNFLINGVYVGDCFEVDGVKNCVAPSGVSVGNDD